MPCAATIDDPIDEHFEKVSKFILGVKEAEGKVLMHCIDGIELSPAFMSAYMLIASFEKRTRTQYTHPRKHAYLRLDST